MPLGIKASPVPTVTQDTLDIFDNAGSPASNDAYVKLALSTDYPTIPRIIASQTTGDGPIFKQTAESKMLIIPRYLFNNASITFQDATVAGLEELRIEPVGHFGATTTSGRFVYNGGGTGAHKYIDTALGSRFPIYDTGAAAEAWPIVKIGIPGNTLVFNATDNFGAKLYVFDKNGKNVIELLANSNVGNETLYVDPAAGSATDTLVQDSGADITVAGTSMVQGAGGNAVDQFWIQVYHKASAPIAERWQYDGGGGQIPYDVPAQVAFGNGFVTLKYNLNASSEGEEVRYSIANSRFEADIGANGTVGLDGTKIPHQRTRI